MFKKLLFGLCLVTGFGLSAQTTASHTIEVELTELVGIEILADLVDEGAAVNPFVFDQPTEYSLGITQAVGAAFRVNASVNWVVNFKSTDAQFDEASSANTMPLTILEIKETLLGTYAALSTSDQQLTTGLPLLNILGGVNTFTADYRVTPGTSYDPGVYSANVTYTISAQ